jgi:hypothetical protein
LQSDLARLRLCDRFTWLNGGPTQRCKQPNRPQPFFALRESFDRRARSTSRSAELQPAAEC